ncbi:MAG TPA: glycogen debranching N-terminal domain-containing protein, partial [Dehalococcoidia bacterium]|nr:glycogen debranching N-terminal domain-containing protein [Dehalococcoidia bacterium]
MLEDTIVVANGSTFAVSGRSGDIVGEEFQGLFKADTRFLSGYGLKVNERSPQTLSSGNLDSDRASFYLTNKQARGLGSQQVTVIRDRRVRNTGLHDEITISNHSQSARQIHLTLAFAADFADVFEIRLGRRQQAGRISVETANDQIALTYRHGHYERQTIITFSRPPHLAGQTASFEVDLAPKAEWQVCVDISPRDDPTQPVPSIACDRHWFDATYRPSLPDVTLPDGELTPNGAGWPVPLPDLATDDDSLTGAYRQAVHDLKALTMHVGGGRLILAAGLPWFMAIFGRDSLISAYQTILLGPRLARDTLQILAKFQATQVNDFRDAQPGKIPHEIRHGELSVLDRLPHARYYGTVDATPLFLILLSEVYRWAGDLDFVRALLPAACRAIEWIDQYGDLDGDGFVEYQRRSQYGLLNQGWKDSNDAIVHADGSLAEGPIALCEVQAYVYRAKLGAAELYT